MPTPPPPSGTSLARLIHGVRRRTKLPRIEANTTPTEQGA